MVLNPAELRRRLAQLPRETRDTLFALGVIAWTIAPHLAKLPAWCGVMALAVLAWRARLALVAGALPGRWTVTALLLLAAGLTLWGERTLLGREAGITMLVVLMTLKTLELRARRDALVVLFLGFFLVLTQFLNSQSLAIGLWLLVAVWGLLTALVLAHMPVGRPPLRVAGAVAARAALLGVPLMLVLFVLFPRIGPLWGLPQDAAGRTGLSGSLRMGGVATLGDDDTIAMRVRFDGPVPPLAQLYWRGPVLNRFDGLEWTRGPSSFPETLRPQLDFEPLGPPVRYEITLEPSRLPLLPLLELTPDQDGAAPRLEGWRSFLRADGQWQLDRPVTERLRFEVAAWPQHRHGPRQPVPGLADQLQLPAGHNPRLLQWAAELRARPEHAGADAPALAQLLLRHIRDGGYTYTLEPGTYGRDGVDEFWFDRKLGFCEHYAVAFVVAMRALGVPSRIVTGYQGADPEPRDGWWIVRQRHAHAWAEYWLEGRGWVRVDPTAAVAPDRVMRSFSLRSPPGFVAGAIDTISPALTIQLRLAWEAIDNRWNQWVLNYSRTQQFDLLRELGVRTPSWQDLAKAIALLLGVAALAGAAWAWWDRHHQDPWQRLQRRVQQRLEGLGVTVQAHHPPRTRAARVRAALGARGEALAALLEALDHARYSQGEVALRGWWRRFAAAARTLG